MRAPISYDDFLDLEGSVTGGSPADHRLAAEHIVALAQEQHPEDEVDTADLFVAAGEQFRFANEPELAQEVLWRAHSCWDQDGLDPRAVIVDLLLKQEEIVQAQEVSEQIRTSRPLDGSTYHYLGEMWDEQGETKRALGWFTRGIMLDDREGLPEGELSMLVMGRWRIRRREGHEPDEYDELALQLQERLDDHRAG